MSFKFRSACLKCSLVLIFMQFFQLATAQNQPDFSGAEALLEQHKKALGKHPVLLVYKDGKLIYQKITGDLNTKTPVPVFETTKWFTTAAVLKMVEEGKVRLDDPVAKYVPSFKKYMKGYITLRHCLMNTTGIEGGQSKVGKIFQKKKFASLEEEVDAIAAMEIGNNPDAEFYYGDLGTTIAARVLEVATKKAFDRLAQEKITRPLKMRMTRFSADGLKSDPSTGAVSSGTDMINFLSMILNKGMFEGVQILSPESVEMMCSIHNNELPVKYAPFTKEGFEYGCGTWILEKDGNGKAAVVGFPGIPGAFPWVDLKKGYAATILTLDVNGVPDLNIFLQIMGAVSDAIEG
ncbi:MAG TPA: serine hydrolase domain-containing protein [Parasegetibacter sp.]